MRTVEFLNIVLLGEGFPVGNVQPEDFHMAGRPARAQIKIPILTQLQAGEFQIAVTPEQAVFGAHNTTITGDKVAAIEKAAATFLDLYTSQRSVRAIGHNIRVALSADELSGDKFLSDVVAAERLIGQLGGEPLPAAELVLTFRRGDATRVTAKLGTDEDGTVHLDLNYHFDITTELRASDVVARFPSIVDDAEELMAKIPTLHTVEVTS